MLKKLEILNYKNIESAVLEFSPNVNCFIGCNGEGKTNLLDAIYFLSFTKSATNHIDSMNIRHGEDMMMLKGEYDDDNQVVCGLKRGQSKQIKYNQKLYKRISDHIGLLPLILISPNDQQLIRGNSEERRRFMDQVIAQYDRSYLHSLTRCNQALAQRNKLLKLENTSDDLLIIYEEIMAEEGERIYAARRKFINDITPLFQKYYNLISENREKITLDYISQCARGPLLQTIQVGRDKDKIIGYSLHGVHKDDIEMTLGGYPIKKEGSQGQNKTYLVSLKLAQFNFLHSVTGRTPILLLDDIFDKLDAERMTQIIKLVSGKQFGQIFITDTNRENIDRILENTGKDYLLYNVKGGKVFI